MSTKSVQARLERLEGLERQRELRRCAERVAARYGVDVEEVLLRIEEITKHIERWGIDTEIRRLAQEFGKSEDEVWADFDAGVAEVEQEG